MYNLQSRGESFSLLLTRTVYHRKNCPHGISITFIVRRQESEAVRMRNTGHVIFLLSNYRISLN